MQYQNYIGSRVIVTYWKRTRCGSEEEASEPFTVTGILHDELACTIVINKDGKLVPIRKTNISEIDYDVYRGVGCD